jgi:hypothetical protein
MSDHLYNGTYPTSANGGSWKHLEVISAETAKSLIGDLDGWLNKAFKVLPYDVADYVKGHKRLVRAVYYHDTKWQLITQDKPEAIAVALEHAKTDLEIRAAYLKRDIDAIRAKIP